MEGIKKRIRPTHAGSQSALLDALTLLTILVTVSAGIVAIVYFGFIDSTDVSAIERTYSPGCEGLSRPIVNRAFFSNVSFETDQGTQQQYGDCIWSYEVLMNDDCAALQNHNRTLEIRAATLTSVCDKGQSKYLAKAVGFAPDVKYHHSLTCDYTTVLDFPCTSAPNDPYGVTILAQIPVLANGYQCGDRNFTGGFSKCQPTARPFVLPAPLVDCAGEVAPLTPRFICARTVSPSPFSVLSQSAAIASLAFTVCVNLFGFLMNLDCVSERHHKASKSAGAGGAEMANVSS